MNRYAKEIYESLHQCPVIDTHEHLENEWNQPPLCFLGDYTRHYFVRDLISSGMDPGMVERLAGNDMDILEKWERVAQYWGRCRHTGYGRMLDLSVKTLYGVPEINGETVEVIERGFQALRAKPGYGEKILRKVCGIEHVMNNIWHMEGNDLNGLFRFVTQIDNWVMLDAEALGVQEQLNSMESIDQWVSLAIKTLSEDFEKRGAKALKMAIAYRRTLYFQETSHRRARISFDEMRSKGGDGHVAQNYVLHAILKWANENKHILQVHTGYQEGNDNTVKNSNPDHLNNLIRRYSNIRFDLFHLGFPYQDTTWALAKMYANVAVNFCWSHILSPLMAQNALREWIVSVPSNKFFAFGGDCVFYDGVVGHLQMAKENVAIALSGHVKDGVISKKRAKAIALNMFYENPREFYGIS